MIHSFSVRTICVYCRKSAPAPVETVNGLKFRQLDISDFRRDPVFQEKNRAEHFIELVRQGHICNGYVTTDDRVASYIWHSVMPAPFELGLTFKASHLDAYLWNCRTTPEFENRGLYRMGLKNCMNLIPAPRTWIVTNQDNPASKKGIEEAGFRRMDDLTIARIQQLVIGKTRAGFILHWGTGTVEPDQLGA